MNNVVIISDVRLNDQPPYNCAMCDLADLTFSDIYSLREHYLSQHLYLNCARSLNDLEESPKTEKGDDHHVAHGSQRGKPKNEADLECSICNKSFSQKSSRDRHIRELHEQPGRFECDQCGLRFSNKSNFRKHLNNKHHSKNVKAVEKDRIFDCPNCPRAYCKRSALNRHIQGCHKNVIKAQEPSNGLVKATSENEENDPQSLAESVLKELKQLQRAIEDAKPRQEHTENHSKNSNQITSIDNAIVEEVTIKDNLYPLGNNAEHKVQRIKRTDGYNYYICEYCSKEFRKSYDYLRHRRIHTKIRPFICVMCKKSFPTQHQLKRHCARHVLGGALKGCYMCPKCPEGFPTIPLFDKHLSSHLPHVLITFNCQQCSKGFQSLKSYFKHTHKEIDSQLNMLKSLLPSPLCLVEGEETEHVVEQKRMGQFSCSICGLELFSSMSLKQHEKRHLALWKYQCNICKGFYASKFSLKIHTRIHQNHLHFKCMECNKTFHTKFLLKRHQLRHSSAKNFKCRYCEKVFKTTQYCRSHMMTHMKELIGTNPQETIVDRETTDNYCSLQTVIETTGNGELLVKELQVPKKAQGNKKFPKTKKVQTQMLLWKCLKCPKHFRFNSELRKHMLSHSDERPYTCSVCLKSFRKNHILKHHLLTHNEDRTKVTCQVCGKQYANNKSLKIHLRIHTGEKKFHCELCSNTFRTSGHLKQHHKSNHEVTEKLFQCDLCLKKCTTNGHLKQHHKSKHKDV